MPQANNANNGSWSIYQLHDMGLNVMENITSIFTLPVEMFVRPWFGTRYFPPPILFLSAIMMILGSTFLALTGAVVGMIPLVHINGPVGMFSFGSFTGLFFLASFIHGIRIWKRMLHTETEKLSTHPGPALPIFRFLPKGDSYWFCRIVLEPAAVYILANTLANMFIIQSPLTLYLKIAALALAMKQYIGWYRYWEEQRNLLDAAFIGPLVARINNNTATKEERDMVHTARVPGQEAIGRPSVAQTARAASGLGSEAGKASPKFIAILLIVAAGGYGYWKYTHQVGAFGIPLSLLNDMQKADEQRRERNYRDIALGRKPKAPDAKSAQPASSSPPEPSVSSAVPEAGQADIAQPQVANVPAGPVFPSFGPLTGTWAGQAFPDTNTLCGMSLELHEENARFGAYTTLSCNSQLLTAAKYSPVLAVLTGKFENGTIVFETQKTITSTPLLKACSFKTLTLTPFGAQTLAATFETSCSNGEIVLRKR